MSLKVSVYIATSLDGFIARKNGDLDWLPTPTEGGEDFGYAQFMSTIDAVVLGRNTYEKVLALAAGITRRKYSCSPAVGWTLPQS